MGRHNLPDSGGFAGSDGDDGGVAPGRRRRAEGTRRGVSVGVIAALIGVVALVGGAILWQFFGDALSRRSTDAANQCLQGSADVAVVADQSIAANVEAFAQIYNAEASPVGDKCVNVTVTVGDSDAVINGLTGTWPAELGGRPALWIPASSIPSARLQSAVGKQIVSDARSLVTSPVMIATRPQLAGALADRDWAALPGLQADPVALDAVNLPGWGSLRLALPTLGAADATYLTAEAVASAAAPPGAPATAGLAAAATLLAGRPALADATADTAWNALTAAGDPAAAGVHAVAITEQQLFTRTSAMPDAKQTVAAWLPAGPVPVADYPTVLLAGPWLAEEQVSAASEFARFMRKPEQRGELARAGFRADDDTPTGNDVVGFAPLGAVLPVADDTVRAAVAGAVAPGSAAATTVVLDQGLAGDEGGRPRLAGVTAALNDRIAALPPGAVVGLWTFDGADSRPVVPAGPVADQRTVLTDTLAGLTPTGGGAVSFTTLPRAYSEALANYRPGQPNSILLITQGPHTDRTLDGLGLENFLKSAIDPNRPVAVNVIDFGPDPDRLVWEAVARLTGGSYQEIAAADSPDLVGAIARMLS
jgi:hypothetical protein